MIENDKSLRRTIDRDTGVFLELINAHGPTSIFTFKLTDQEAVIKFGAERFDEMRSDGTYYVEYKITSVLISGNPRRVQYLDLLRSLLGKFGDMFGYREDIVKDISVKVIFKGGVAESIEDWERASE